jgi:transcriptional regulator ATRX
MNWKDEIFKWLKNIKHTALKVFFFKDGEDVIGKVRTLEDWYKSDRHRAGCLLLGYEAFKTM